MSFRTICRICATGWVTVWRVNNSSVQIVSRPTFQKSRTDWTSRVTNSGINVRTRFEFL